MQYLHLGVLKHVFGNWRAVYYSSLSLKSDLGNHDNNFYPEQPLLAESCTILTFQKSLELMYSGVNEESGAVVVKRTIYILDLGCWPRANAISSQNSDVESPDSIFTQHNPHFAEKYTKNFLRKSLQLKFFLG